MLLHKSTDAGSSHLYNCGIWQHTTAHFAVQAANMSLPKQMPRPALNSTQRSSWMKYRKILMRLLTQDRLMKSWRRSMMLALFIHLLCCTSHAPSSSGTTVTATHTWHCITPLFLCFQSVESVHPPVQQTTISRSACQLLGLFLFLFRMSLHALFTCQHRCKKQV